MAESEDVLSVSLNCHSVREDQVDMSMRSSPTSSNDMNVIVVDETTQDVEDAPLYLDLPVGICPICHYDYKENRKVFEHMFNDHNSSRDDIDEFKKSKREHENNKRAAQRNQALFLCSECHTSFMTKRGLQQHMVRTHANVSMMRNTETVLCPVPNCQRTFYSYIDLARHAPRAHRHMATKENNFRIVRAKFSNFDRFTEWRRGKEREYGFRFHTRTTSSKIKFGKKSWTLACPFTYRRKHDQIKCCSAFMRVLERYDGVVDCVVCFGHLHNMEIACSPWSEKDDSEVIVSHEAKSENNHVLVDGEVYEAEDGTVYIDPVTPEDPLGPVYEYFEPIP